MSSLTPGNGPVQELARALKPLREFADGVLELTLPKNVVTSLQRIAIQ